MKNDNKSSVITIKKDWSVITYREFEELTQVLQADIPDHYRVVNLLSILSGWSVDQLESLPLFQFQSLLPNLEFLQSMPENVKHKDEYTINNRGYILHGYVPMITTAQYLDYTNYIKEAESKSESPDLVKLTSCFLIPKGHEYNDGYDMNQVWNDIYDMNFNDVRAVAFFLQLQYAALLCISRDYLEKDMKKMKIDKKKIKETITPLNNMVSSLLSSK